MPSFLSVDDTGMPGEGQEADIADLQNRIL